ncbi:unnamed protein product, partial [Prorocentrum cordatum]
MAKRFEIHSPDGGVAKQGRIGSPLDSLDDDDADIQMVGESKGRYKGESKGSGSDDMREMMRIMMKDMRYVKNMRENNANEKEAKEQATAAKQAAFEAKIAASSVEGEVEKLKEQVVTKENIQEVMRGTGKYVTGKEVEGMIKEAMNNI